MKLAGRAPRKAEENENCKQKAQLCYAQTFLQDDL